MGPAELKSRAGKLSRLFICELVPCYLLKIQPPELPLAGRKLVAGFLSWLGSARRIVGDKFAENELAQT